MSRDAMLSPPPRTPVFRSTLRALLEARLGNVIPIADLGRQLNGWVTSGDLRRDELEWSGLPDWLRSLDELLPDGKVSRGEVLSFLDAFDLPVEEKLLGFDTASMGPSTRLAHEAELLTAAISGRFEFDGIDDPNVREAMIETCVTAAGGDKPPRTSPIPEVDGGTWQLCIELAEKRRALDAYRSARWSHATFDNHTLPGGVGYRELLLTLPPSSIATGQAIGRAALRQRADMLGEWLDDPLNAGAEQRRERAVEREDVIKQLAAAEVAAQRGALGDYRNPKHWKEPNVIAHVRFKERVLPLCALARRDVCTVPAFVVRPQAATAADAAAMVQGLIATHRVTKDSLSLDDDDLAELAQRPASDIALVFTSEHNAVEFAQATGGQALGRVELPLHARVLAANIHQQTGVSSYLVFTGPVPEKRVLFIEEIQSDWAQAGRVAGFLGDERPGHKVEPNGDGTFGIRNVVTEDMRGVYKTEAEAHEANRVQEKGAPPPAPFVGSTEGWLTLALKRMIRYAAERGFDYVAWTNGTQQLERFNKKETITQMRYKRLRADEFSVDAVSLTPDGKAPVRRAMTMSGDQLRRRFGKEFADQLVRDAETAEARKSVGMFGGFAQAASAKLSRLIGSKQLEIDKEGYILVECNDGIKVGNYGLESFYDLVIPRIAKRLVLKLGGTGLVSLDMRRSHGELGDQVGFEVTEPMRARALAGMPRYHRAWHGSPHDHDGFDSSKIGSGEGNLSYGFDGASRGNGAGSHNYVLFDDGLVEIVKPSPTDTPAFKAWFGDSKIVDAEGKPLVVYHGTNADIEVFDFSRLGQSVANPTTRFGFFFTEDPKDAELWADRAVDRRRADPAQNIIPAFLALKNPRLLSAERFQHYLRTVREGTIEKHLSQWKNAGYDGLVTMRDGKRWFVAFNPEQIKSAIGNVGAFDPSNPNIRYSFAQVGDAPAFADVSEERLKREIAIYSHPNGKTRGFVTRMSIADFLEVSTPDAATTARVADEAGAFDPAAFDDEVLPILTIDPESGQVLSHEGRRRAAALHAAGAADLPVVIVLKAPSAALQVSVLKGCEGRGAAVLGEAAALTDSGIADALRVANRRTPEAARVPAPPFYSALIRAIEELPQGGASADQWRGIVANLTRKGIKEEEIEWTGVLDWLDLQEGKLTKSALLDYLRDNEVRVEEVVLGTDRKVEKVGSGWAVIEPNGELYSIYDRLDEARAVVEHGTQPTRFHTHVLPGGERYRELLLTLPSRAAALFTPFEVWELQQRALGKSDSLAAYKQAKGRFFASEHREKDFTSSHFPMPNILAHIRFDERTDAAGRRLLFVEEFQSDWGQQGKKDGFQQRGTAPLESGEWKLAVDAWKEQLAQRWAAPLGDIATARAAVSNLPYRDVARMIGKDDELRALEARQNDDVREQRGGFVPQAPFVTNTKSWVSLALKRVIRYAAENGFDAVAWTTGDQQADRYDLSKQVDSILVTKEMEDRYSVWADRPDPESMNGRAVILHDSFPTKKLPDVIGKALAERAIAELGSRSAGESVEYSGSDLKVGGQGMLTFYDDILVKTAADVLKKLDGPKVSSFDLQSPGSDAPRIHPYNDGEWLVEDCKGDVAGIFESKALAEFFFEAHLNELSGGLLRQPGFEITPALREKALGGLPLFMQYREHGPFPGLTPDLLRREIDNAFGYNFTQKLIESGSFRLLRRERELPAHLLHPRGGIAGVYDDVSDTTYLVAEWIRPDMVKGMLLHEVGVHYGLRRMLGDRADELFAQARELVRKGDPSAMAAFRKVPPDTFPVLLNEEILAYLVGDLANRKMSVVQRAVSKMKGFLFELGADIELTPSDMTVMAEGCVRRLAARNRPVFGWFADLAGVVRRAASFAANPLPERIRKGVAYAFAGPSARTAKRSLLAEAAELARPLDDAERDRYFDLEGRYAQLNDGELDEYERLSLRVDVQFDPDITRQRTGWFQGLDGRWRFEIDDSQATLKQPEGIPAGVVLGDAIRFATSGGRTLRLSDVLDHPRLYAAYPALANVRLAPHTGGGDAAYNPQRDEITFSTFPSRADDLRVLLHEVQHVIQHIEGFALGGAVSNFSLKSNAFELFNEAHEVYLEIKASRPDLVAAWEAFRDNRYRLAERHGIDLFDETGRPDDQAERRLGKLLSDEERAEHRRLLALYGDLLDGSKEAQRFTDALHRMHVAAQDRDGVGGVRHLTPRDQYMRLAGEIEARDVEARIKLPDGFADLDGEEAFASLAGSHHPANPGADRAGHAASLADGAAPEPLGGDGSTRRTVLPYSSQGIPHEEIIVRFDRNGESSSREDVVAQARADNLRRLEAGAILALQRDDLTADRQFAALMDAYAEIETSLTRKCAMGTITLTPSAKTPGAWQVTWLGAGEAPVMDAIQEDYREALDIFWSSALPTSDLEFTLDGELKAVRARADLAVACPVSEALEPEV